MKHLVILILLIFQFTYSLAQKPKLIVGLVVDQMRNDYIYRYWDRFGEGGFKKLVNKGYYLRNAHFNYVPTYTGPGHSSIYTGTTPRFHGIIANDWYDKETGKMRYCVDDELVQSIGGSSHGGKKSPVWQLSSTLGDELKISSNGKSKVFALALKDRSAILPAGHAADAAFWYDDSTGYFISSSWYLKKLPQWLTNFNEQQLPEKYLKQGWKTLYPITSYTNSLPDENPYEKAPNKKDSPVFPYEYEKQISKKDWGILKATPYGNSITKELAIACLRNEGLGKDEYTDLLAISFSSPDIIGHSYGPRSVEIEDVYLRLDKDLEELINVLDKEVGKNQYLLFLTADHGGADIPAHLNDEDIPAGYLSSKEVAAYCKQFLYTNYGDSTLLLNCSNEQLFLKNSKNSTVSISVLEQNVSNYLLSKKGIMEAYPSEVIKNHAYYGRDPRHLIQNGYHHQRSGNIAYLMNPAWMDYGKKGTTHGVSYSYDTHVPIVFYGNSVRQGSSLQYVTITQIAPTVCDIIRLNYPNACTDSAIEKAIKKAKK